ncbi:UDP-N-acetyl-D-galactosamine:polypeptide N-acetylgalactosaminyltransferase T3, putative [Eimeria tenella]|uniref:UDP-N-acetyl-D-galactosamine:polypeptide N-acetylgalactosaminyltransferase T3, putative n=1 Tax=Eimeria tenella TaxID=5802 RepID=U6KJV3_EIMTE|nr:UDP-N-acetyl-D-galactosamine:polypeptide N-acetylgalactosaminyltransferase T3, putative [Eimeria tenella]CDJ37081.1 UDP-N-acetyl-D-galactosamine:polypeptide N-acetylgalactosaminyltransferase T3, putative [Eimeria tenella]|eukprot:XP_013227919.1 UDP-N-acetyl-D-galactosamine:polypeptide N-acetylgalactosaminyltransferase T3, putative [Eimeria tenella]
MVEGALQHADWRRPLWGCLQLTVMALGFGSILLNAVLLTRYMFPAAAPAAEDLTYVDAALQQKAAPLPAAQQLDAARSSSSSGSSGSSSSSIGVDPERMHGPLGLKPDGTPNYVPGPPPPPDLNMAAELARGGGFNLLLSDHLPLDRPVPESRAAACAAVQYDLESLPAASVLIVFHNEALSTLLRSVHSVLNRTPPQLLQEVLLVDDGSTAADVAAEALGGNGKLQQHLLLLPRKVQLLRSPQREGIVGARLRAIRAAAAAHFVVLDSHVEVQRQWLEPLLLRLQRSSSSLVMPQVDGIDAETFEHVTGGIGCQLGFLWQLVEHSFEPHQLQQRQQRRRQQQQQTASAPPNHPHPHPHHQQQQQQQQQQEEELELYQASPAMAGGLFASSKAFFFAVGGYDEGFRFWGAENLELSFRAWQCGGRVECAACSRVFHVFRRGGAGYAFPASALAANKLRTLAWMDRFGDLAWRVLGRPAVDYGAASLQQRLQFRSRSRCRSFQWFLENVFPESDVVHLSDVPFLGKLKNEDTGLCLEATGRPSPGSRAVLRGCQEDHQLQEFMYFKKVGHVMPVLNDEACLTPSGSLDWCRVNDLMWWDVEDGKLRNRAVGKCLAVKNGQLGLAECGSGDSHQKWQWDEYNPPEVFELPPVPSAKS